jgi:cytochrome P450
VDVFHFQLASQANMYAGIGWTLVRLLTTDDDLHLERVRKEIGHVRDQHGPSFVTDAAGLDKLVYLEAVIVEALRLAQQSITLRKVLQPCVIHDEDGADIAVPPGWTIATLLSITNMDARGMVRDSETAVTSSQPTMAGDAAATAPLTSFHPERYVCSPDNLSVAAGISQGRLTRREGSASVLSSTFGHGSHACPGRSFALSVSKLVVVMLLQELELQPQFKTAVVPPSSVGALARVSNPCLVKLKRKKRAVYV